MTEVPTPHRPLVNDLYRSHYWRMTRLRFIDGEWVNVREAQIARAKALEEAKAHFVHGDTFKYALRHPKTGEMVDSMTRWNAINREHKLEVVGNDWISPDGPKNDLAPERINDERFNEAFEKAWATETSYDKRAERAGRQRLELERYLQRAPEELRREIMQMRGFE